MLSAKIAHDECERITKDFNHFLTYCWTLDEHDKLTPIKKMPMDKIYLQELAYLLVNEPLLLIEKSRQMMVTWMGMAYCLWIAMCHQGRRVFIQSKKEQDANDLVDRCKFIYDRLPEWMKMNFKANPYSYCKLEFGKITSIIKGIPQGPEQLRQFTASVIWSDEMAFQENSEEAYVAAMPTVKGGGQYIGVSSPNFKEFFYRLKSDLI